MYSITLKARDCLSNLYLYLKKKKAKVKTPTINNISYSIGN